MLDLKAHFEKYPVGDLMDDYLMADVIQSLSGEIKSEFRIPAGDRLNQNDYVLFSQRELFTRFASLHRKYQAALVKTARNALDAENTEEIKMDIKWSKIKRRVLLITRKKSNPECIEFRLL